jgi:hypothetical protein
VIERIIERRPACTAGDSSRPWNSIGARNVVHVRLRRGSPGRSISPRHNRIADPGAASETFQMRSGW